MTKTKSRPWWLMGLLSLALITGTGLLAACGDDDDDPTPTSIPAQTATSAPASPTAATSPTSAPSPTPTEVPVTGEITVFAAASLTNAFTEVGEKFREKYPNTTITFSFLSSSALATQINEGAPADVFASADLVQMKNVTDQGNAEDPTVFATNVPVVVVPKSGSPVAAFADLGNDGVRLVLAGPEVPIGRYAREILTSASAASGGVSADFSDKVLANLRSNEANVRDVLAKVQLGEADAGIVYGTDAAVAAADVTVVEIPTQYNVIAEYPIVRLSESGNAATADAFVAFILGEEGQAILASYGFGKAQ